MKSRKGIVKYISMKKIYVTFDFNDGNFVSGKNNFHGKVPHRMDVINKVIEYLGS